MKKRSKKYNQIKNKIDTNTNISILESLDKVKELSTSNFKGSIEVHISTKISKKENKQILRGSVYYKNKVGKNKKILLLTDQKDIKPETKKEFNYVGLDLYIKKIQEGWDDFDLVIASPSVMPKIAILGKILGPKSLMPNPKLGTVTDDLEDIIKKYKGGKFDFKSDSNGTLHTIIGNIENTKEELLENLIDLLKSFISVSGKSASILLKTIYVCPTMGPSIKIHNDELIKLLINS
jgi:large subunit ribosomal protein L1